MPFLLLWSTGRGMYASRPCPTRGDRVRAAESRAYEPCMRGNKDSSGTLTRHLSSRRCPGQVASGPRRRTLGVSNMSPERHHPVPLRRRVLREHRVRRHDAAGGACTRRGEDMRMNLREPAAAGGVLGKSQPRPPHVLMRHLGDMSRTLFPCCFMGPKSLSLPLTEVHRRAGRSSGTLRREISTPTGEPPARAGTPVVQRSALGVVEPSWLRGGRRRRERPPRTPDVRGTTRLHRERLKGGGMTGAVATASASGGERQRHDDAGAELLAVAFSLCPQGCCRSGALQLLMCPPRTVWARHGSARRSTPRIVIGTVKNPRLGRGAESDSARPRQHASDDRSEEDPRRYNQYDATG